MDKPKPSFAPVYAFLYPNLATIARKHGYALAIHGSLQRDMDVIAIPWIAEPSESIDVVTEICDSFCFKQIGLPDITYHGRMRYTLSIYGEAFVDLSFMPISTS
jgi:hypothetical protein